MKTSTISTTPVAVITGSAQRIGKALALALHAQGYNLVLHYFKTSALDLAAQLNAVRKDSVVLIQADLNDSDAAERIAHCALEKFNNINLLINNASSFYKTPVGQATPNNWDDLFNSNAKAPFFLSQALAPSLIKNQGRIINIADIYAFTPKREHTLYCMAKAANVMLTQSLAVELAPHVLVNGIAPGAALWPEGVAITDEEEKLKSIPLGKIGGSQAIVEAALFLINSSYTTGQIIKVDGGKSIAGIA
jgi:pteridine reductase